MSQNPEQLLEEIERLRKALAEREQVIATRDHVIALEDQEISYLERQVAFFKATKYGPKSEVLHPGQRELFNEAERDGELRLLRRAQDPARS